MPWVSNADLAATAEAAELDAKRREDAAYSAGVRAGLRRAGSELRTTALRFSVQVPRHTLVLMAKSWEERGR